MAKPKVTISCSDPGVQQYCENTFVQKWNTWLPKYLAIWEPAKLAEELTRILTHEAERQEWYQYETVDGHRQMVLDDNDAPVLLIPTVVIE